MVNGNSAPFGALLIRFRAAAGLTQEQLAARAGLSRNAIAALERGRRHTPRGATAALLADALGLDEQVRAQFVAAARSTVGSGGMGGIAGTAGAEATERSSAAAGADRGNGGNGGNGAVVGGAAGYARRQSWWLTGHPAPLVDRVQELETILQQLRVEGVRLLTLVGPAGVGKTRLALAAAEHLAEDTTAPMRFPDGVTPVDLTPIRDPALVLDAIARALGLLDTGSRPLLERLVEALAERRQVVVLDNFEQVLPAASQLAELLAACPGLALLVTSRVPLRLRWEQMLRLAPLPVPDLRAALPSRDALLAIPSVKLFVERARARRADFTYTEKEAPMMAQLAVQLDGLPLALELAAARLDVLSLPVLTRRLGDRLQLLTSEASDLPERQRSLEAAVGWSCELLSAPERRLFRCLGVFVGRVSLDAIAAVVTTVAATGPEAGDGEARDDGRTFYGLLSLAEKSLVLPLPVRPADLGWQHGGRVGQVRQPGQQSPQVQCGDTEGTDEAADDGEDEVDPEPAFGMLETVREYAWKRLTALGEQEAARRAHARYFTALAERADPLLHGCDQRAWFFRLEREHDNLRAALRWLLDQQDDPSERERALRLAGALGWFWYTRGNHMEGVRWLEEALARVPAVEVEEAEAGAGADPERVAVRTRALVAAGRLLTEQGKLARAHAVLEEALTLAERWHDAAAMAEIHTYLGLGTINAGEVAEGTRLLQAALRRWEALGDPEGTGKTRFFLGYAADTMGDDAVAASSYTDALRWLEAAGDAHLAGHVRCHLGMLEWRREEVPRAVAHIQAGIQTSTTLRDRWLLSFAAQATLALVEAHVDPTSHARLLGATDALAQATGANFAWERMPVGSDAAGLRERLVPEEGELAAAYRDGRALPFGEVAALALRLLGEVARAQPDTAPGGTQQQVQPPLGQRAERNPLSARELEVLRLVAQGLSSKAIGRQLFLAPSTVNYYLTSVFHKLGVDTRAQAVAVASQRGLY